MAVCLPGKKFFWDPDSCGHWAFQVKGFTRYLELSLRKGDGMVGEGVHRRKESRLFHQDLLSALGIGAKSEKRWSATQLLMRLGIMEGAVKTCQPACFAGQVPREWLLRLGAGIKQWGVWRGRFVWSTGDFPQAERKEELQQVACHRARDETGFLEDLEEKWTSSVSLSASLSGIWWSIFEAEGKQC